MLDIWGLVEPGVVGGAWSYEVLNRMRLNCASQEGLDLSEGVVTGEEGLQSVDCLYIHCRNTNFIALVAQW
jgi:hypothetical protein